MTGDPQVQDLQRTPASSASRNAPTLKPENWFPRSSYQWKCRWWCSKQEACGSLKPSWCCSPVPAFRVYRAQQTDYAPLPFFCDTNSVWMSQSPLWCQRGRPGPAALLPHRGAAAPSAEPAREPGCHSPRARESQVGRQILCSSVLVCRAAVGGFRGGRG